MMRRRHKKSRKGCLECKKRHIKCDETRPRCINCATVERECQYSTATLGDVGEGSPSGSASASVGTSPQPPGVTGPGPDYFGVTGSSAFSASVSASFTAAPDLTYAPLPTISMMGTPPDLGHHFNPHAFSSKVDLAHMQLLHHYLTNHSEIYPFVQGDLHTIIVKMALYGSERERPFLLHSLLALSARHLSSSPGHQGQQQSRYYHDLAIQLQTQALTLFNSFDVEYFAQSLERRIPAFMFSAIIGFHALCDMLSFRDEDFGVALNRFTEYLRLHRGIISVMDGYWEDLKRTEMGIVFQMAVPPDFIGGEGEGQECDDMMRRLEGAGLAEEELTAVRRAVNALQWVFDAAPEHNRQIHVLCYWAVIIPQPLMTMIEMGRREALVILAYYFLALHYCKDAWLIGGSGEFLLRGLVRYLGPDWEAWVERPMRLLSEALEAEDSQFSVSPDVSMMNIILSTMAARNFIIDRPSLDDAGRIAEIHIAAMDENPLLHAQCPTPRSILSLQKFLKREVASHIRDSDSGILVARHPGTGVIVGFARWASPSCPESVKLEESASGARDIEGCQYEFFDGYVAVAEKAKERVMTAGGLGATGCYHLSFVCIDPAYQGQGAGKMLSKAVLDMAKADGLPVYLESTDVAVNMYAKLGFRRVDSFETRIPSRGGPEALETYEEVCMIWKP
ncbi:acyl-CoA N-acyltransferase [Cladorrhinum sp. PSN332]|nr:acyl-CoA N-acyltransferase [Cladorrhinum sp. PSN332]